MPGFSWTYDKSGAAASDTESQRVNERLDNEGKRRVEESRGMLERIWSNVKTFGRMIKDPAYSFPTHLKFIAVIVVLYVLSPVDFVPELFFGPLGVIDDAGAIALIFTMVMGEIEKYRETLWPSRDN